MICTLQVDEKWSIAYDSANNDRPVSWLRYNTLHSRFDESNAVVALFYALKDADSRVRNRVLALVADQIEDYCSDMPDLAGHGHSVGLRDAILIMQHEDLDR
jgi:hypothetical protein